MLVPTLNCFSSFSPYEFSRLSHRRTAFCTLSSKSLTPSPSSSPAQRLFFLVIPQTLADQKLLEVETQMANSRCKFFFLVLFFRASYYDLNENTSVMQLNKYIFHLSSVSTCFGQYIAHHQEIIKCTKSAYGVRP